MLCTSTKNNVSFSRFTQPMTSSNATISKFSINNNIGSFFGKLLNLLRRVFSEE